MDEQRIQPTRSRYRLSVPCLGGSIYTTNDYKAEPGIRWLGIVDVQVGVEASQRALEGNDKAEVCRAEMQVG
jgi:hypothetical protein